MFITYIQTELDRMKYLPESIRRRLQSAMPMLPPIRPQILNCAPPSLLRKNDKEVDPWTLLEQGVVGGSTSSNSSDQPKKPSHWLEGCVRVKRRPLTYIGAMDDDEL